ncbi:MAG: hypothetical protein SX243_02170 [Acidobacteriota bacterium]|nr:hypothetical protein [Acidobacteriota bacterium]
MIRRAAKDRGEQGYNMVILAILVTILTIGTAAALPLWTSVSQREKEEELIFRGLQYAEAIRCFQRRFQRYPIKLEELEKVKPRCIRQLYPDPMTDDGEWGLIYAGGPGTQINPNQAEGNPNQQNRRNAINRALPNRGQRRQPSQGNGLPPSRGSERQRGGLGPIAGVYSKADGDSIKVFMGKTRYDQWAFTAELVSGIASLPDRPPMVPSGDTFGRPFPNGIQPQITFQLPNQNPNQVGGPQQNNNGAVQRQRRGQGRQGFGVPVPAQGVNSGNNPRGNQGNNGLNRQQQRRGGFGGQQRRGAGGFGGGQRNPTGGGDG